MQAEKIPHVLFIGPPGSKSLLAKGVAGAILEELVGTVGVDFKLE